MREDHERRHRRWRELSLPLKVLIIIGGVAFVCGMVVLVGFVVVWLWNWLMPAIFHLPTIRFWQALGLLVLTSILFNRRGSLRQMGRERSRKRALRDRLREAEERGEAEPGPSPEGA